MAQGEIVYSARIYYPPGDKRVSRFQIYTSRPDGTGRVALTNNTTDNLEPKWSPEGGRILFWQSSPANAMKLCVMEAGGGPVQVVATFVGEDYATDARWHPDGKRVLLVRNRLGSGSQRALVEIWDVRTRSAGSRFPGASGYALSPSGDLLYIATENSGQLVRLNEKERATPMPVLDSPVWKEEDTLVALEQGDIDKGEGYFGVRSLLLVDTNGKVTRKITPRPTVTPKADDEPVAILHLAAAMPNNPDTFLLYCEHREAYFYTLISTIDGGVGQPRSGYKKPVWSPDSKWFVTYASRNLIPYGSTGKQVYVGPVYVGTDISRPDRKITPGLSWCGGVDWRPGSPAGTAG